MKRVGRNESSRYMRAHRCAQLTPMPTRPAGPRAQNPLNPKSKGAPEFPVSNTFGKESLGLVADVPRDPSLRNEPALSNGFQGGAHVVAQGASSFFEILPIYFR